MPRKPLKAGSREPHATDLAAGDPLPTDAVVKRLGAVEVEELDGTRIALGSLWQERAAAVVWLRHYG